MVCGLFIVTLDFDISIASTFCKNHLVALVQKLKIYFLFAATGLMSQYFITFSTFLINFPQFPKTALFFNF